MPRASRKRRGVALVEFAIVLALMLTIVLGCVDFGRFAYTYIAVTNAAREGTVVGIMYPPAGNEARWLAAVRRAVADELSGLNGFDDRKLVVSSQHTVPDGQGRSRVRVDVSYPFHSAVPWLSLPAEITLRRTVQMRVVRQ